MSTRLIRVALTLLSLTLLTSATLVRQAFAVSEVVISQVYGGGGQVGAQYRHDFIELHNRGNSAVSLDGWSVQYTTDGGTSWQSTPLMGTIAPGGYFLVREAEGPLSGAPITEYDVSGTIPMATAAGKVALVTSTTLLSGSGCPIGGSIVDFVGYGAANCYEGAGAAPTLTNTTAALRNDFGCSETDNNAADFSSGTPAPRYSGTASFRCYFYLTYTAGAGGTIVGSTLQTVNHGASGTEVTAVPNMDHHFVDWTPDGSTWASRSEANVTADLSHTANFAINKYTLTYVAGAGGTITGSTLQTVNHGASGTEVTAAPNEGYHFVDWTPGGSTSASRTETNVTADQSYMANFAINSYTVTYNGNTHDGGSAPVDLSSPHHYNTTVTVLDAGTLTKTGHTFSGWNTAANGSGTPYAPAATFAITANTTLYAQWVINTYTLTYDGNGNTGGSAPVDPSSPYNHDATVTVLGDGTLTKTGHTFAGWNTAVDGTGTPYAPAATFAITANTTLYAQWTINTYTVTYDGNTNDGGSAPVDVSSPYNYYTVVTVLGAGDLAKTGHTFAGWNTAANGSGTPYGPAAVFAIMASTTLYAQWTINTYTLTVYIVGGGTVAKAPDQATYVYGDNVALTATADPGWVFIGFSGDAGGDSPASVTMTGAKTVVARFGPSGPLPRVVISQVYGGGGDGARYHNDFVELYNAGNVPVDLTGWTLQYAASGGTTWSSTYLGNTIHPRHYFLIQEAAGVNSGESLPTPDAIGVIPMDASMGKVALVKNRTLLSGSCPSGTNINIVDFVGYGPADCSEGGSPAVTLSDGTAGFRNHDGCDDTNVNSADFSAADPNPRNTASLIHVCTEWVDVVDDAVTAFALGNAVPNPARAAVRIPFALPREADVRLEVMDVQGRLVATLANGLLPAGRHEVSWDGSGNNGAVHAGLYLVRMRVAGTTLVRRVSMMR